MTLNSEQYRANRIKGLRGQGAKEVLKFEPNTGSHASLVPGQGLVMMNRAQSRRRVVDRTFTRKGYAYGNKLSKKRR